jgi:hypothetical protein
LRLLGVPHDAPLVRPDEAELVKEST